MEKAGGRGTTPIIDRKRGCVNRVRGTVVQIDAGKL